MLSLPAISRERRNCVARLRVKAGSAASPLIEGLPQLLSTSAPLKCALPRRFPGLRLAATIGRRRRIEETFSIAIAVTSSP